MEYTSEKFTREIILNASNKMRNDKELIASISKGSYQSSSKEDRENYFRYGSIFFYICGTVFILLGTAASALTIIFFEPIGYVFFLCIAPGSVLWCLGPEFDRREKKAKVGLESTFDSKNLILTSCGGVFVAFILSMMLHVYL